VPSARLHAAETCGRRSVKKAEFQGVRVAVRPMRGESGDSPVDPQSYERISTQLSALLAEMVKAQEVAVADSWSPEVQPGGTIGRFRLARELGRGGFGVVFEALDGELNRTVALKVVRPGTRIAARGSQWLLREAEAVARLNHPNIVTLHDFGQGPTGPYLVFELLRGQSLAERLRSGPLPLDEVIDVGVAVSRALVHAHGAGVIHRDLTASNVHLAGDGAVKVLDFGLAHLFGRDGANDGGTPAYMAPEQWEGDQGDARTDLFALGVILHQALSGAFPYKVDKGWSEALEPGETPRLPRRAAPARLRRLVRSLIEREPDQRPESARAVRDTFLALRKERDGAGRRRLLWGAVGVAVAAIATAGWLYLRHEPPPGEQVKVVLAAMENSAGQPALDAVPGLLSAALEPSPRVKLVPPARLAYVARQAGTVLPEKLDAERGKELARVAGAAVLLVPGAWLEEGAPAVGVRAIEAETGKLLFRARAAPGGAGGLAAAVDLLADRIRRELRERSDDRRLRRPVAETVTASPEAARVYYEGVGCLEKASAAQASTTPCRGLFEQALALDPSFPLAHFQLASLSFLPGDTGQWARGHLKAALEAEARLPAREAALVRALTARVDGRRDEALRIYDQLLAANPEDPELLSAVWSLYSELHDWASATRYLEKLVAVEPDADGPLNDLIAALGRSNRTDALRSLLSRLELQGARRAGPVVAAYVWLGDHEAAVRAARRAVEELGDAQLENLRYALLAAGQFPEAEAIARRQLALDPSRLVRYRVDMAVAAQGRITEALRWVAQTEQLTARSTALSEGLAYRQAMIAAATGSAEQTWQYAAPLQATAPRRAAQLAVVFALLDDLPHAEALAADLEPEAPERAQYEALRVWRRGDTAAALARLALSESQDPWPATGMAPAYLMAEISAAAKDDVGVLTAVDRFHRLPPDRIWRAWAYPRSLYLAAVAHRRVGELGAARLDLERLLRLYARADPGVALLKQAQLLRAQLQRP
jgi:eukaryotic-like serine/threonine-protein kinase